MTIHVSDRLLSVSEALQWLNEERGILLSRRSADRRLLSAVQRVRQGCPEAIDRQVRQVGHVYMAPTSWWVAELERRPSQQVGRPRKPSNLPR